MQKIPAIEFNHIYIYHNIGDPHCPDNFFYSSQVRNVLFFQITETYIRYVHIQGFRFLVIYAENINC